MTKHQTKEYCEAEFENIEASLAELFKVIEEAKGSFSTGDLAAIATFIHNFYNGIENILKRVLILKNKKPKEGITWHKDLLASATEAEIISGDLCTSLSNYLSFRHFFIHGYGFTLQWEALQPLVNNINKTYQDFKAAVIPFLCQKK
jgi:uncharacterized protein YutE (UPF0331/DUF86 family)